MSLVKRNNLLFPDLMNEIFNPDWFGGLETAKGYKPAVNIEENEKEFKLTLIVPGRSKEDFEIEVEDDVLSVVVSEIKNDENNVSNFTRKEFEILSFKRAFTLPEIVNIENIEVSYSAGILSFNLPKKEEALPKPKRSLAVK